MDERLVMRFQKETRETVREVFGQDEKQAIPCNMINCFCMYSDYTPLTLDEWIEVQKRREEAEPGITDMGGCKASKSHNIEQRFM
jgi:hypothetical protein